MDGERDWRGIRVFTVGHSTRSLDELVALLRSFDVSALVDVRTIPRSRHNPQFNVEALASALPGLGVRYVHLPALGGLRHTHAGSINTGWRNASFRGYADYMQTEGFEQGLADLRALAANHRVAIMCAEAVPWRCHRSLVADALTVRGATVEHIANAGRAGPHRLTPFAKVRGGRVFYPGDAREDDHLPVKAPFHLEATVRVLQRRPTNAVEVWDDDRYLRALPAAGRLVVVEVKNHGTIDVPDVRLSVHGGDDPVSSGAALARVLRKILGLDLDPGPMQHLAESEPALRPTATALRGMRPPRFAGLFEAFANVVPFQQVSLDAGIAVTSRLVERFGAHVDVGGRRFHVSPDAGTIAGARVATLRGCGLSTHKAESLRAIARAIASGELTEEALTASSTPDALRTLTELPGIGPWSAALVLLRGLGRLDVFPAGDVGVQRGLGALLRIGPNALRRVVDRFGDLRGYLYFCSLGASLLAKGLVHPAAAPPARDRTIARGESLADLRTGPRPRRTPLPSATARTRRSTDHRRSTARRR